MSMNRRQKRNKRKQRWTVVISILLVAVLCTAAVLFGWNIYTEKIQKEREDRQIQTKEEEKVAQMFVVTPEALTGVDVVISAGDTTREAINQYPVGGIIYFTQNLTDLEQVKEMISNTQNYSRERVGLPMLIGVDEEGGTVSRIDMLPSR